MAIGTQLRSIAISGAGVIGLSVATVLVERGHRVSVFDPGEPGRGASWAAAGMLAPAFEAAGQDDQHPALLEASFESRELWKSWAKRLEAGTDTGVRMSGAGSIALAVNAAEDRHLDRLANALADRGMMTDRLARDQISRWEPGIGPAVCSALALACDGHVDNRAAVSALIAGLEASADVEFHRTPAPLELRNRTLSVPGHDHVVLAAGWQTPSLLVKTPAGPAPLVDHMPELAAITPVKGQLVALAGSSGRPPVHTLRSADTYVVPRHDRVIIGATSEPGVSDREVSPATVDRLQAAAARLLPELADRPVLETWAGIRPGSPDHAPLIGEGSLSGATLACGHYRNGILLSPLTAMIVADLVEGQPAGRFAQAFAPSRFMPAPV